LIPPFNFPFTEEMVTPYQFDVRVRRPLTGEIFTVASTDGSDGIACNVFNECDGGNCIASLGQIQCEGAFCLSEESPVFLSPPCGGGLNTQREAKACWGEDVIEDYDLFDPIHCRTIDSFIGTQCYRPCRVDSDCPVPLFPTCMSTHLVAVGLTTTPVREQFILPSIPLLDILDPASQDVLPPAFDGAYNTEFEDFLIRDKESVNFAPPINDLSAQFSARLGEPFVIEADWRTSTSRLYFPAGQGRCDMVPLRLTRFATPGTFERTEPEIVCESPPCDAATECKVGFVFEIFVNSLADPLGP